MSLPAMLHTVPARSTAARTVNATQTSLMGLGFHFAALAVKRSPKVIASSTPNTAAKYKDGYVNWCTYGVEGAACSRRVRLSSEIGGM